MSRKPLWAALACGMVSLLAPVSVHAGAPRFTNGDVTTVPAATGRRGPAIVDYGSGYLVTWAEGPNDYNRALVTARLDRDGRPLDASGALIPSLGGSPLSVAASHSGSQTLLCWEDVRLIDSHTSYRYVAALVGEDGQPTSASPQILQQSDISLTEAEHGLTVLTSEGYVPPSVSVNGRSFVVAWPWDRIRGTRIDFSGDVVDQDGLRFPLHGGYYQISPRIGWNGTTHLVVYSDSGYSVEHTSSAVVAVRITPNGGAPDRFARVIAITDPYPALPAVASDGEQFLVVWMRIVNAQNGVPQNTEIRAAVVDAKGRPKAIGGFPVSHAVGKKGHPAVAWDGSNYIIVWPEVRSGVTDLYVSRVSRTGVIDPQLPPGGRSLTSAPQAEAYPQLISAPPGRVAMVYEAEGEIRAGLYDSCLDGEGRVCPFEAAFPSDGTAFTIAQDPPTFWWEPGENVSFRLEFSNRADFSGSVVRGKYVRGTDDVPSAKTWDKVVRLFGLEGTVYWRVAAKPRAGDRIVFSSTSTFTLIP